VSQGHDVDTLGVMALLRDALATSGMSQAAFARALGTSAPRFSTYLAGTTQPSGRFCMRAQRLASSLSAAATLGLMSAPVTAAALREQLRAGDHEWAWRMLLQGRDHLRLMLEKRDAELIGSWEAAPGPSGATEFDALLAALTKHEFETAGRAAPAWTQIAPLPEPWVPAHPFLSHQRVMTKTPEWLRELNIYIPERDLVTA
jgi:transcriptional regulator with XRE-family HTH domain